MCGTPVSNRVVDAAGALVDLAERQRFGRVAAPRASLFHELHGVRADRRQRNQIEAIVLEDRFQRAGVAAAQEAEVARRNVHARDVADAPDVAQHALERAEPAAPFAGGILRRLLPGAP